MDAIQADLASAMGTHMWSKIVRSVVQRIDATNSPRTTVSPSLNECEWVLNRVIYKGAFSVLNHQEKKFYFQASVSQFGQERLEFKIYHPKNCQEFVLSHPDSVELINEFTYMSFIERHVQITILLSTIVIVEDTDLNIKFGD